MNMSRGEVWCIDFEPQKGDEIKKNRPAVIVSDNRIGVLRLKVIVPLLGWQPHFQNKPWIVKINKNNRNGLKKGSGADVFQVRSLAEERFKRPMGTLTNDQMKKIEQAFFLVLNLPFKPF